MLAVNRGGFGSVLYCCRPPFGSNYLGFHLFRNGRAWMVKVVGAWGRAEHSVCY